jgi:hypothetical protein
MPPANERRVNFRTLARGIKRCQQKEDFGTPVGSSRAKTTLLSRENEEMGVASLHKPGS